MAELFEIIQTLSGCTFKSIYNEDEFHESATTEESSVVRQEGKRQVRRNIRFYNLDAAISVGSALIPEKVRNFASGPLSDCGSTWSTVTPLIGSDSSRMRRAGAGAGFDQEGG